jgi:signal peptidase II
MANRADTSDSTAGSMTSARPQLKWLWISLVVVVFDQLAKQIAERMLVPHQAVELLPFFDWYLTYNTGAAFSFLAGAGGWQRWLFTVIAIVISGVILQWLRNLARGETLTAISLALILGGAIGNLIDRVYLGHVIDYIQVWLGSYPFPAFNIADASISVGAFMLVLSSLTSIGKSDSE